MQSLSCQRQALLLVIIPFSVSKTEINWAIWFGQRIPEYFPVIISFVVITALFYPLITANKSLGSWQRDSEVSAGCQAPKQNTAKLITSSGSGKNPGVNSNTISDNSNSQSR